MRQTRVLHLMQCTYLAGTEQTMYALMRGLHGPRYRFRIASLHPSGEGAALMEKAGIATVGHAYRGRFGWRSHLSLRRTIARTPCDLVLVTGPTVSGSFALAASSTRRRVLTIHYHHGQDARSRRRWRAFYRLCGHQYHTITYPSDFIRREAEGIAPWIAPRACTVRYNVERIGRSDEATRRERKRALGLDADRPVVGNASALIPRKRFDVFLNVARLVARKCPDVQFLIAGDGPQRKALEARTRELGIRERTHFVGWVRQSADAFDAMDVLLFNSDADAAPRTPMEALGAGVPVVASERYGGTCELIEHGRNGFLLNEHNVDALSEQVLDLIDKDDLREVRIERGLQTIRERYSRERFLRTYDAIFQEALAE